MYTLRGTPPTPITVTLTHTAPPNHSTLGKSCHTGRGERISTHQAGRAMLPPQTFTKYQASTDDEPPRRSVLHVFLVSLSLCHAAFLVRCAHCGLLSVVSSATTVMLYGCMRCVGAWGCAGAWDARAIRCVCVCVRLADGPPEQCGEGWVNKRTTAP